MAFEGLSDKLQRAFKKLTGKGKLNEQNIKEAMREVRLALLEADVNYIVVKDFINKVTQRCIGTEILSSLNAGQQVIKVVNKELTALMGGSNARLTWSSVNPRCSCYAACRALENHHGAAKLALHLKRLGKKPMLAACDIYRPAAIQQLQIVGEKAGARVFEREPRTLSSQRKKQLRRAKYYGDDVLIIDTAPPSYRR